MHKLLTLGGLIIGAAALIVQFVITMQAYFEAGRDVFGALGAFFSYYTILTNLVLVLIYLSEITRAPILDIFRRPVVRGLMAANMMLVALFVYFVLRHLAVLEGLFYICDIALHYVTPAVYFAWWVSGRQHGSLRLSHLPMMLLPTFVYFIVVMARGLWVAEYPYPILNAVRLGYGQVAINAVSMTIGLSVLCTLVVMTDRWLSSRKIFGQ